MPIEVWYVFAGIAALVVVAGWGKLHVERKRHRAREALAEALGLPVERASFFALLGSDTAFVQQMDGVLSGFQVRVTIRDGSWTEIRIALQEALPGNLRILPKSARVPERLRSLQLRDPELSTYASIFAEDSAGVRDLFRRPDVRDLLLRFFRTHPESRLSSGELVMEGPRVEDPGAVRRAVDHALALVKALGEHAVAVPEPASESPAADLATQAGVEFGPSMVQGLAAAMSPSGTSSRPAAAPETLGPIGAQEAQLRARYQKIQGRAFWTGLLPMGIGGALMVLNRHGGSMPVFLAGAGVFFLGGFIYGAQLRCPQCEERLDVVRYFFPSECHHCGLRLR